MKTKDKLIIGGLILSFLLMVVTLWLIIHLCNEKWQLYIFSTLFIIVFIIGFIDEFLNKKKSNRAKAELLKITEQLFVDYKDEFINFYSLYVTNQKKFLTQNIELLEGYKTFVLKRLKPIEVIYIFADSKKLVHSVDWRGEENDKEIETSIDELLKLKHQWVNTSKLRSGFSKVKNEDDKFIIDLFKSVDKDLQSINKRLLFFELNWEAYVFTVVPSNTFKKIKSTKTTDFHGVEKMSD